MHLIQCEAFLTRRRIADVHHFCRFGSIGDGNDGVRLTGYMAWIQADGHQQTVSPLFSMDTASRNISRPANTLKEWAQAALQTCNLHGRQRSVRPCKLEHTAADWGLHPLVATFVQHGSQAGPRDRNAALSKTYELTAITSMIELNTPTVLPNKQAAIQDSDPPDDGLKPLWRAQLTELHTAACIKFLERNSAWFRHVFWPDDAQKCSEHGFCTRMRAMHQDHEFMVHSILSTASDCTFEGQRIFNFQVMMNPASSQCDVAAMKDICHATRNGAAEDLSAKHLKSTLKLWLESCLKSFEACAAAHKLPACVLNCLARQGLILCKVFLHCTWGSA